MTIEALTHLVINVGFAAALVLFFVYQSHKREEATAKVIDEMRKFQQETLVTLVAETTAALKNNTNATERHTTTLDNVASELSGVKVELARSNPPSGGE
mgnify:CR=1 FL=1